MVPEEHPVPPVTVSYQQMPKKRPCLGNMSSHSGHQPANLAQNQQGVNLTVLSCPPQLLRDLTGSGQQVLKKKKKSRVFF